MGRNLVVLLENGKKSFLIIQHCERVSTNSDFMALDAWM